MNTTCNNIVASACLSLCDGPCNSLYCRVLKVKERREKFLTAKYGSHQMALIRKRLAVEMWLYDELQKLYEPPLPAAPVSEPYYLTYLIW